MDDTMSGSGEEASIPVHISNASAFEKHAQTVLGLLIASLVAWQLLTTHETATKIAVLEVKITSVSEQIKSSHDNQERQNRFYALQGQIANAKLDKLEEEMAKILGRIIRVEKNSPHLEASK